MQPTKQLQDTPNEAVKKALEHASIPALICSLVHMTGNTDLIQRKVQPSSFVMGDAQQSIPEETRQAIREQAYAEILKLKQGQQELHELSLSNIREMIYFITGHELSDAYTQFALSELALDGTDGYKVQGFDEIPQEKKRNFHVAVVGAGMSGLLAAIRLQQAGIQFTVFEKNSEVGGTWFENRYPGCRVDSPNHVYSYSFAPNDWPQHFSDRGVLLDYFRSIADEYDLRPQIQFETEVTNLTFDRESSIWRIETNSPQGTASTSANAVIIAVGQLNRPKFPDIPRREQFQGPSFHSAQWDHEVDLSKRKVAVIGTGASAFQFTPEVVRQSSSVDVYLRTPPWVAINPLYQEHITKEKHWLLNNVPFYDTWFRFSMFWATGEGLLSMARCDSSWNDTGLSVSAANEQLRNVLTQGLETQLAGRDDLIRKLTPQYPPAAKRMLIDNGTWYRTLKDEKVRVIDDKISAITETGIALEDGPKHDYDVIIYGTGFHASKFFYPMDIYGADGTELHDVWGDDPRAYRGITIPNYPNLFTMYGPNTNIVVNGSIIFFSECEMYYVMSCIKHLLENDFSSLECKQRIHDEYNKRIDHDNRQMAWGASDVNAWYKNAHGRVTQNWPGTLVEFWEQSRDFNNLDYHWF